MIRIAMGMICGTILCLSCTDPPPEQLTYKQRKLGDSLAQIEMKRVADSIDSTCELRFEEYVQTAYDSILRNRKKDIQRLMK